MFWSHCTITVIIIIIIIVYSPQCGQTWVYICSWPIFKKKKQKKNMYKDIEIKYY